MDERGANIDLVFRNGLRDYEVLPPPEAWDSIHPAIKVKKSQFVFLRAAAAVTVIATVSFLAYMLGRDGESVIDNTFTALNIVLPLPISVHSEDPSVALSPVERSEPVSSFVSLQSDASGIGVTVDNTVALIILTDNQMQYNL